MGNERGFLRPHAAGERIRGKRALDGEPPAELPVPGEAPPGPRCVRMLGGNDTGAVWLVAEHGRSLPFGVEVAVGKVLRMGNRGLR